MAGDTREQLLDKLIVKRGSGTDDDVAAVRAEIGRLSQPVLAFLKKKGVKIVVCRESVTDFETGLRGKLPRGWDPAAGKTWDDVPGAYMPGKKRVVIATVAGPGGARVVPPQGQKHGCYSLAVHEAMHGHDIASKRRLTGSRGFVAARNADFAKLSDYQRQAGNAGVEETFAETAAQHYAGKPGFAAALPSLAAWWAAGPAEAMSAGGSADSGDAADAEAAFDSDAPIGEAIVQPDGSLFIDLRAEEPGVALGHAAFTTAAEDSGYDEVRAAVAADAGAADGSEGEPVIRLIPPYRPDGEREPAQSTAPAKARAPTGQEAEFPLFGGGGPCGDEDALEYDEDGSLALGRALRDMDGDEGGDSPSARKKACPVGDLDGSWYLQLTPRGPHLLTQIRGPLRIEVARPRLRISGDIYVRKPSRASNLEVLRPITDRPLFFGRRWYPQLPTNEYSWYFRSLGVSYNSGKLVFKFERRLWNRTRSEFINQSSNGSDTGFMEFRCVAGNMTSHELLPQATLQLNGTANIGGTTYDAVATKTSPFYRGCAVEVDAMTGRSFPLSATTVNGSAISFESIYRTAGWDCAVTVDQTALADDDELSTTELQTALANNRRPATSPDAWRLWLLVGSSQGGLFGLMFDDIEPFREGTAGFYDGELGDDPLIAPHARNKKLGEVPEAFLRTLVHEAGHAFNLFHPKHDVHAVPVGTTLMNQTGDVMGFATTSNPYPGNITFAFDDHNRTSLIHSPDPQVAPGWKRFGWGHGSLSSGIAEPVDASGFLRDEAEAEGLKLELVIPDTIFRGQFVAARFVVTNTGGAPRAITAAINLSQGDLRLLVTPPTDELNDVRDVVIACGDRPMTVLEPGESLTGMGQIFYTNVGFTFRHTGRYVVSAELDIGDDSGEILRSAPVVVLVRAPGDEREEEVARLTLTLGVGRAFALGDYGMDEGAKADLERLANEFGDTETGIAAGLVLANSSASGVRDLYSGDYVRHADSEQADAHFDRAAQAASGDLVRLAAAVVAPTAAQAPLLDMAEKHLRDRGSEEWEGDAPGEQGFAREIDLLANVRRTLGGMR